MGLHYYFSYQHLQFKRRIASIFGVEYQPTYISFGRSLVEYEYTLEFSDWEARRVEKLLRMYNDWKYLNEEYEKFMNDFRYPVHNKRPSARRR